MEQTVFRCSHMTGSSVNDWHEDFPHENGQYYCKCDKCACDFIGHKNRIRCRKCTMDRTEKLYWIIRTEINPMAWEDYSSAHAVFFGSEDEVDIYIQQLYVSGELNILIDKDPESPYFDEDGEVLISKERVHQLDVIYPNERNATAYQSDS